MSTTDIADPKTGAPSLPDAKEQQGPGGATGSKAGTRFYLLDGLRLAAAIGRCAALSLHVPEERSLGPARQ